MKETFRNDNVHKNMVLVHVVIVQTPRYDKVHRKKDKPTTIRLGRVHTTTHKRFCTSFICKLPLLAMF